VINKNAYIEKLKALFPESYFDKLPDDEELLKKEARNMVHELFNLQENYYQNFNESIGLNQRLREFLVKYGAKFRLVHKKNNKLKERIESNNLKSNMTTMVNRDENDRIKDIINLNKQELNIYKDIFQVNYNDNDLKNFKEERNQREEEKDKQSLLRVAETLFRNPENLKKLSHEKRQKLETLFLKYDMKFEQPILVKNTSSQEETKEDLVQPEAECENNDFQANYHTQPQANHKIEFSDDEEEPECENDSAEVKVENTGPGKNDKVDQKLNVFLNDFYTKRRISQIPFRRISQGNYEFGTQKVMVKVDNEKIKVRVGGGYLLLDKFIEMQAPVEEAKLMNAKNISNKYAKNVCVKKVTGGKAIYALENVNARKTPDKKLIF